MVLEPHPGLSLAAWRFPGLWRWGALLCLALAVTLEPGLRAGTFARTSGAVERLERLGQYAAAEDMLDRALASRSLNRRQRQHLEFARERLSRIRQDYRLTSRELFRALGESVRDLTEAEFERWTSEGRFDGRNIDGVLRFANASARNLFFRYPDLAARRLSPQDTLPEQRAYLENALALQAAARASQQPYVLPKRFAITMTVRVVPGTVPAGQTLRAWLPVPRQSLPPEPGDRNAGFIRQNRVANRALPDESGVPRAPGFTAPMDADSSGIKTLQDEFHLLDSSSPVRHLGAPRSPIRSAYLEQPADADGGAVFWLKYAFTAHGISFDLDTAQVHRPRRLPHVLRPFVAEGPHVVFTERMRQLAWEIAGHETNPLRQARKFYDWISDHIQYSFAPEYSTVRNLGERCLTRRCGDCGMETFVFMTLCRLSGIPARWQSGWTIFPGAEDIHDWCEIHLAPYGWVPVDPYMGIYARQLATALEPDARRQLRDFYFGGLSQYRVIVNSDHCQALVPAKPSFRSDPVDFQRGELEAGGRNLYFDRFHYELTWEEIPAAQPSPEAAKP
jgi:transglutaminase-like putative cysteine protease